MRCGSSHRQLRARFKSRPHQKVMVVLEHTAGQGRTVGHRFEHLAAILTHLDGSPRVGVCLDTCHLLASGYNIADPSGYDDTFEAFERLVGFDSLEVLHGNDSKKPCGSRVDRHEHIGKGFVGIEPFRRLLNDPRFAGKAILIETEKAGGNDRAGTLAVDPYDKKNRGHTKAAAEIVTTEATKNAKGSWISGLLEHHQEQHVPIVVWRPARHCPDMPKACARDLRHDDRRGNAMTTPIVRHTRREARALFGREIDDCEAATRFERGQQADVELVRTCQMMVDVAQEDRVTTFAGKVGRRFGAFRAPRHSTSRPARRRL